jgi:hypothetical protein
VFLPDGCLKDVRSVHAAYVDGTLSDDACWAIEKHLLACRRCENSFDALFSSLEDAIPVETIDRCAVERQMSIRDLRRRPQSRDRNLKVDVTGYF